MPNYDEFDLDIQKTVSVDVTSTILPGVDAGITVGPGCTNTLVASLCGVSCGWQTECMCW